MKIRIITIIVLFPIYLNAMSFYSYNASKLSIDSWYKHTLDGVDGTNELVLRSQSLNLGTTGKYIYIQMFRKSSMEVQYEVIEWVGEYNNQKYVIERGFIIYISEDEYFVNQTLEPEGRFVRPFELCNQIISYDYITTLCDPYDSDYGKTFSDFWTLYPDAKLVGTPLEWAFMFLTGNFYVHRSVGN